MLREVTRKEYMFYFAKIQKGSEAIDTSKYSNTYYSLDNDAYVGVEYLKKGVVRINGLFSLRVGRGKELLKKLIAKFKEENKTAITLNCTKELRDKFYCKTNNPWYFREVWRLEKIDYSELVLFL